MKGFDAGFFIGLIVLFAAFVLFGWGTWVGSKQNEIKSGHPIVIDNKVYRCSERSE